jgi:hypothetical protein
MAGEQNLPNGAKIANVSEITDATKIAVFGDPDGNGLQLVGYIEKSSFGGANPNYSTTETLTGGTWIDGKPIYRKTKIFSGDELSEDGIFNFSLIASNIETVLPNMQIISDLTDYDGIVIKGFFYAENFTIQYSDTFFGYIGLSTDTTLFDSITVTIEYTKTTDPLP